MPEAKHFNVILCTLVLSSNLARSDIAKGHFDYIFIDESGFATEPEVLIPMIGLGANDNKITANVVLLGDHKQLGPVLMAEMFSGPLGLGVSLMERIMSCAAYQKNPKYNECHIVQLLDNYRSHPRILAVSSILFYDGLLRPKMNQNDQKKTKNLKMLPNKNFPIIFHDTNEPSKYNRKSSYNTAEVKIIEGYVEKLLKTEIGGEMIVQLDIGIVTPYLAQLNKLKKQVGKKFPEIEMGTAEHFQGREKSVIIISTVKSNSGIGFLSNERRFNVMMSRAKSLQIVVGSARTLSQDRNWNWFIRYCKMNNAFTSENDLSRLFKKVSEIIALLDQLSMLSESN